MASEIKVDTIVNAGGDNDSGIDLATNDNIKFDIAGSQKAIIDASGNVGIGTTSPETIIHATTSSAIVRLTSDTNGTSGVDFGDSGDTNIGRILYDNSDNSMRFTTNASECMRINSDGDLIVNGTASGGGAITAYNVANAFAPAILELNNVATDFSATMLDLRCSSGGINSVNGKYIQCHSDDGSTIRMKVLGDGDLENTNGNYGGISDLKLKENIADSNSQWDDLKNLKVKKFSFKADKKDKADKIGVIAQDLEDSNMSGLVRESKDFDSEGNDLGTTTKSVKYSILYMKAVKALQEAMARIETLEAKVTALESK